MAIAMQEARKIGMVRFDRSGVSWVASINLAPEERGKGYGAAVLQRGIELLHKSVGRHQIMAEIKQDARARRV